jgi:hypothetical protein
MGLGVEADFDASGNLVLSGFIPGTVLTPDKTTPLSYKTIPAMALDAMAKLPAAQKIQGSAKFGALTAYVEGELGLSGNLVDFSAADKTRAAGVLTPIADVSVAGAVSRQKSLRRNAAAGHAGFAMGVTLIIIDLVMFALIALGFGEIAILILLLGCLIPSLWGIYIAARGGDSAAGERSRMGVVLNGIAALLAVIGMVVAFVAAGMASLR